MVLGQATAQLWWVIIAITLQMKTSSTGTTTEVARTTLRAMMTLLMRKRARTFARKLEKAAWPFHMGTPLRMVKMLTSRVSVCFVVPPLLRTLAAA